MGLPLIYRRANPLSFPGGRKPGFDQTHPAANKIRFSGIASNGNFINLLRGIKGTVAGSPTASITRNGPAVNFLATTANITFTNNPSVNDTSVTIAGIITFAAITTFQYFFETATVSGGWKFGTQSAKKLDLTQEGVAEYEGTQILVAGVPYFAAVSAAPSSAINFVTTNLTNGQIITSTVANTTNPTAGTATYTVGNDRSTEFCNGALSAVMFSGVYLPMSILIQWAQRPWDFWYPPTVENLMFSALGGTLPLSLSPQPMIYM
jgi:hypothetical protein